MATKGMINSNVVAGDITMTGLMQSSVSGDITASTTQAQGQQQLLKSVNVIAICAVSGDAVTLPSAVAGRELTVINNGAETLGIFPASGDDTGAGVDTFVSLSPGSNLTIRAYNDTTWEVV